MEQTNKTKKDHLQAVWFAAGTAVAIACVERAVVVSIFQQWHMWVFLALNLLLIAILFTSTHPPRNCSVLGTKSQTCQEPDTKHADVVDGDMKVLDMRMEEREESYFGDEVEDEDEDENEEEKLSSLLTNEELNERVEAFISRFRQEYLVSEVKIRRSDGGNVMFSKSITV